MKYLLLHRAVKNFGDFLIYQRSIQLLQSLKAVSVAVGRGHEPLEKQFSHSELSDFDAIIIPGGPALSADTYPRVYPLSDYVLANGIPLFFLGVGTYVYPYMGADHVPFSTSTRTLLEHMQRFAPIGVRDHIARRAVAAAGLAARMNGCPSWYDLNFVGIAFEAPQRLRTIVCSVPSRPEFVEQFLDVVTELRRHFPDTRIAISFNRGITKDEHTPQTEHQKNVYLLEKTRRMGCDCLNMAFSTEKATEYDASDLHVGYRVHSHTYFLSHRKPSILIAEDARGMGMLQVIPVPGFHGWRGTTQFSSKYLRLRTILSARSHRLNTGIGRYIPPLGRDVTDLITAELDSGFSRFQGVGSVIDSHFRNSMKPYIEQYLP